MQSKEEMLGIRDTFAEAWRGCEALFPVYAIYLGILVALLGVTAVFVFLLIHSLGKMTGGIVSLVLAFPVIVAVMIGSLWMTLAAVHAAQNTKTTKKDAYRKAWALVGPYGLLMLADAGLVLGLSVFFLVPGVVFAIFSLFAVNVMVKEKVGFFEAILRSLAMVKGHGWPVFGRLIVCWLAGACISIVPILGGLAGLVLVSPFNIAFNNAIYEDLRRIKKAKPSKPEHWTKPVAVKWALAGWGIGLAGVVVSVCVMLRRFL